MDTQQKHIYNKRIKEFFPLFDKIKKEDDPIYNARVDFNTVKFLTERTDWDWNEDKDKNKACGVILQECDKTARQELEDKAKEELNKYITIANNINDDVKDKKVSIYGNHASITLEDNKKEFKISEFLNSDFCEKNGISGFSTLHSDGKSGMHGFVAEEGGKKIRHYAVTDGSYEMTLNWYVNGEKCTIKINIDKDGVELIEGNGITEDQLKANKDVKIGGLFLHEIEFREKGQVNEVQTSFESTIRNDDIVKDKATHKNRGAKPLYDVPENTSPPVPPRTSSLPPEMEFNKYIRGNTLDLHELDSINIPELLEFLKKEQNITNINLGWNSIDDEDAEKLFRQRGLVIMENCHEEENSQNKKTPPPLPLRTSSLPPKANEQTSVNHGDGQRDKQSLANSPAFKAISQNQNDIGKDKRYDNPTFTTFGYTASGRKKTVIEEALQVKSAALALPTQDVTLKKVEGTFKSKESGNTGNKQPLQDDVASILARKAEIEFLSGIEEDFNNEINSQEAEEKRELRQAAREENSGDQVYNLKSLFKDVIDEQESGSQKPNDLHGNEQTLDNQQQPKTQQQEGNSNDKKVSIDRSRENDSFKETNFNTPIASEQPFHSSITNSKSDSGYSSPANSDSKSQTDLKQVGRKLEEHINLTPFEELKNTLGQENLGLKPADQSQVSEETKKRLREDGLLKDSSTDVKTVAERENNDTNSTVDKNSELYKLLEKDKIQLEVGVIEEERGGTLTEHTDSYDRNRIALANRNKRPLDWAKRIAESQQEKDTNKGISV